MSTIETGKKISRKESKDKIIKGEEKLFEVYDARNLIGEKNLVLGIDGGSTQTRVMVADDEFDGSIDTDGFYVIPSDHAKLDNERVINAKSDKLYEALDSFIVDTRDSVNSKIGRMRVVRGTKLIDSNMSPLKLTSTEQKIDEPTFYTNIVDSIGYALLQKYQDQVPSKVNVIAGIALPPDDNRLPQNREKFRKNIIGTYEWTHRESNVSTSISILDVNTMTEPEAFAEGYYAAMGEEMPEVVLVINMGGRSIGIEIIRNGKLVDAASITLPYGGNQFATEVGTRILESENNKQTRPLPIDKLKEIILTGKMPLGKSSIDVVEEIKEAQQVFADRIFNDISVNVIDTIENIDFNDISEVLVSGGLIRRGDYDASLADNLSAMFKEKCEYTDFTVVEENYIPVGLMIDPLNANTEFIYGEEDVEEDESVEDETSEANVVTEN